MVAIRLFTSSKAQMNFEVVIGPAGSKAMVRVRHVRMCIYACCFLYFKCVLLLDPISISKQWMEWSGKQTILYWYHKQSSHQLVAVI